MLKTLAGAGQSGPVILVAGEADLTCVEELNALISAQLAGGTRELTIDVSGLRFADSSSIRTLMLAAKTLKERGGRLVLLNPQRPVARVLTLLGADQMFAILGQTQGAPESDGSSR
jgi:anti-sigma B factor antagonist